MQFSRSTGFASLLTLVALSIAACRSAGDGTVGILLCDGETLLEATPGSSREEGQVIADRLMAAWQEKNPAEDWEVAVRRSHRIMNPHDNSQLLGSGDATGQTYTQFTERDLAIWERETGRMVAAGAKVFHSADDLGSTIAVSCDMCHPDAANTHPETYPKFQTQLGRTALLRDMINWCLQHPCRAEKMAEGDPRMRAMEAYIYAQRKGRPLQYNKH